VKGQILEHILISCQTKAVVFIILQIFLVTRPVFKIGGYNRTGAKILNGLQEVINSKRGA